MQNIVVQHFSALGVALLALTCKDYVVRLSAYRRATRTLCKLAAGEADERLFVWLRNEYACYPLLPEELISCVVALLHSPRLSSVFAASFLDSQCTLHDSELEYFEPPADANVSELIAVALGPHVKFRAALLLLLKVAPVEMLGEERVRSLLLRNINATQDAASLYGRVDVLRFVDSLPGADSSCNHSAAGGAARGSTCEIFAASRRGGGSRCCLLLWPCRRAAVCRLASWCGLELQSLRSAECWSRRPVHLGQA